MAAGDAGGGVVVAGGAVGAAVVAAGVTAGASIDGAEVGVVMRTVADGDVDAEALALGDGLDDVGRT